MAYCINPDCSKRENPDNCAVCQTCKTPLIFQNRYKIKHPLQVDKSFHTEIFEIEDLAHQNQIKVLKSLKDVTPHLLQLFEQEVSILTSLQHPGLPVGETLFPLVLNTGRQLRCLVMEKIPGENLQTWLSNHQYVKSSKIALSWLKQLTQILQFVHENNFFHRDIKPANIMLSPDGNLTLIDFGTARKVTQTVINNQSVTVIISQGYTAPEQHDGHAVIQSDFYALGQTFIYLLTGLNPANQSLKNWSQSVKDKRTPKRLIELIEAMTNSHPHHRPQTDQEILEKIVNIEKYPWGEWQKLLPSLACGVVIMLGTKLLYDIVTVPGTCDYIGDNHLSCGEESLIPVGFGKDQPPISKAAAIDEYRNKKFASAVRLFEIAFQQEADPETLIYLNNAKINIKYPADKIHTIAVAVPLERRTDIGLEILKGAAQAQSEVLKNGQPLRIVIADDSNLDDIKHGNGNNAREVAQKLVKYGDLLAVLGHYSSEATKKALPIYSKAGVVSISATSTSNNLKNPFFFRTVPSDRINAQSIAKYIFSQLKQRQAAIFYSQGSEYAESLSKEFREAAKSFQGGVINHQPAFNLSADNSFNPQAALNLAQTQGASAIVLIPDGGVGLHNAISNAKKVIQADVNQMQIVAGDSLYSSDLLTSNTIISSPGIEQTAWAVAWHPINGINSQFVQQAQILWRIDSKAFLQNTEITWRTATSYDAVMALSKAISQKPTRKGIQQIFNQTDFSFTGATGTVKFAGGDRLNGTTTIIGIRRSCNSQNFGFVAVDKVAKCR
jgi:eukaryotic-like serine/threonine-protein kinase